MHLYACAIANWCIRSSIDISYVLTRLYIACTNFYLWLDVTKYRLRFKQCIFFIYFFEIRFFDIVVLGYSVALSGRRPDILNYSAITGELITMMGPFLSANLV